MNYKISIKVDGKWLTVGNIMPSKFADSKKLRVGLRAIPELKKMMAEAADGGWVNADAFPADDDKPSPKPQPLASHDVDDEIPF